MHPVALCLLVIPTLCLTANLRSHVMPIPPAVSVCPTPLCVCAAGDASKGQLQLHATCTDVPHSRLPTTVSALTINGTVSVITKRKMLQLGTGLKVLDLTNCKIQTIEAGSFDTLIYLETLKLTGNLIEKLPGGMFKRNLRLRQLYLNRNLLRQLDESVFAKMTALRALYLDNNRLTEIPAKMPRGLTTLSICHNNLGPTIDTAELREIKLKQVDLSGNPIEELTLTNLKDIGNVEDMCLGDKAITLPENATLYLRHIAKLTFIAVADSDTRLSANTLHAIGSMNSVTSLSIINYSIDSVSFLDSLTHLITLYLENVTVDETTDISSIQRAFYTPKPYLREIVIVNSPTIAQDMANNLDMLETHLQNLHKLSLQQGGIRYLPSFNAPNAQFQLDISGNPLHCDCKFAWFQNKEMFTTEHLLAHAVCETPEQFKGVLLKEFVHNYLYCPSTEKPTTVTDGVQTVISVDSTESEAPSNVATSSQVEESEWQEAEATILPRPAEAEDGQSNETDQSTDGDITGEQEDKVTTDEGPHRAEHHEDDDNHQLLYIILGSVLLILLVTGIILLVVYCLFKKKGLNKVEPSTSEPSFKQLQATEDTSLIKGVKK